MNTEGGDAAEAVAAVISASETTAPETEVGSLQFIRATPFHEGVSAFWSRAGLLAYGPTGRAFPVTRRHQWRTCGRRPRSQWRVRAGVSPASHHPRP